MEHKVSLEVYVYDEYIDTRPERAEITITPKLIERVLELSDAVKNVKAFQIQEIDYSPDWLCEKYEKDDDGTGDPEYVEWEDGSMDTVMLNVSDDDFRWKGWIKHTNILVETESIFISNMLELKKVYDTPKEDLPLLLNNLKYEEAKKVLELRLKEE